MWVNLDLVLWLTGSTGGRALDSSGALSTESEENRCLLWAGIASSFKLGMQLARFVQLSFAARQIIGATKSLLSMLADAVLLWTVGAACIRAASTVTRVFMQSER